MTTNAIQQRVAQATDRLIAALEAGHSQALKDYLAAVARFHNYSVGNTILIYTQRADATRVAGYRAWQRLGRNVKHGEKGILIMAPIVRRRKEQSSNEEDDRVLAFRSAHVFDVSQTDGRPLPEFARTKGDPGERLDRLLRFATGKGIVVETVDSMGAAEGASLGGRILLRRGLTPPEAFSTLAHEIAHELMHRKPETRDARRMVRETEAEAVAYVVCQAAGLEGGTAASDYIQLYNGDKAVLVESLRNIQATARRIIEAVLGDDTEEESSGRCTPGESPTAVAA